MNFEKISMPTPGRNVGNFHRGGALPEPKLNPEPRREGIWMFSGLTH